MMKSLLLFNELVEIGFANLGNWIHCCNDSNRLATIIHLILGHLLIVESKGSYFFLMFSMISTRQRNPWRAEYKLIVGGYSRYIGYLVEIFHASLVLENGGIFPAK
jgi:hypothetical protein